MWIDLVIKRTDLVFKWIDLVFVGERPCAAGHTSGSGSVLTATHPYPLCCCKIPRDIRGPGIETSLETGKCNTADPDLQSDLNVMIRFESTILCIGLIDDCTTTTFEIDAQ